MVARVWKDKHSSKHSSGIEAGHPCVITTKDKLKRQVARVCSHGESNHSETSASDKPSESSNAPSESPHESWSSASSSSTPGQLCGSSRGEPGRQLAVVACGEVRSGVRHHSSGVRLHCNHEGWTAAAAGRSRLAMAARRSHERQLLRIYSYFALVFCTCPAHMFSRVLAL